MTDYDHSYLLKKLMSEGGHSKAGSTIAIMLEDYHGEVPKSLQEEFIDAYPDVNWGVQFGGGSPFFLWCFDENDELLFFGEPD